MSFTLLPPETIVRIIQYLNPVDIKSTQTVSRYLRQIIANDPHLQYVLELDKSGYIVPRFIRQDLDYGELIQAIRDHRSRWQRVELGEPKSIEAPDALHAICHGKYLSDGVYALCFETITNNGDIRSSLRLYQLPSSNKGTDYKHWIHDNLGFCVSAFVIQPELDLMVLLEYSPLHELNSDHNPHRRYRIHLRTATSNEPHPLAIVPSPLLDIGKIPYLCLEDPNPVGLYGRILFLRFTPNQHHPAFGPVIILFDWIAGEEVGRIKLGPYAGCSVTFISEEYLVIPQGYKHNTAPSTDRNQAGSLLIFHLPPYTEGPEDRRAKHIATLAFPNLCEHQNELRLRLCGGAFPIPDTAFWSKQTNQVPKIYDLNRWSHICLYYEAFNRGNAPRANVQSRWTFEKDFSPSGLLYMSSQALLDLLGKYVDIRGSNKPVPIPWETWCIYAACQPVMDLPGACMWGRKSAFLHYDAGIHSSYESHAQLVILDFIPSGRPTKQLTEDEKLVETLTFTTLGHRSRKDSPKGTISTQQQVTGKFIEPEVAALNMRYRRTIIDLESEKHQSLCVHGLEMDDEHLVTALELPTDFTGRRFFYVYTL
ncbi:hypothetical protein B0J17DRAFT_645934 [Rhizoctonia solani]|nr:hypothetical protein B0J17DRAFT_645934 [Rhizoctonia solani]